MFLILGIAGMYIINRSTYLGLHGAPGIGPLETQAKVT